MKKATKTIAIALALCVLACACIVVLSACNKPNPGEKTVTVTVGDKTFSTTTEAEYFDDLLKELKSAGKLSAYETSGTGAGTYVTAIDGLQLGERGYFALFHTMDAIEYRDVSEWAMPSQDKDGRTYYYSGVGVASLPVVDGVGYMIIVATY